jgi:hypothetical protein
MEWCRRFCVYACCTKSQPDALRFWTLAGMMLCCVSGSVTAGRLLSLALPP